VNTLVLKRLAVVTKVQHFFKNSLCLLLCVVLLTQVSPGQDRGSKIPDGEAQFTPEQLEEYYLVYKNEDVRYLRTIFNAHLKDSGGTEQERQTLSKWSKEYFRSKFVVLSREDNAFGGALITIMFQDRPDKVFVTWVYPKGAGRKLTLRKFDAGEFSDEDIRRINVRYKKLLNDKVHAM
jgi:hypothetical protein